MKVEAYILLMVMIAACSSDAALTHGVADTSDAAMVDSLETTDTVVVLDIADTIELVDSTADDTSPADTDTSDVLDTSGPGDTLEPLDTIETADTSEASDTSASPDTAEPPDTDEHGETVETFDTVEAQDTAEPPDTVASPDTETMTPDTVAADATEEDTTSAPSTPWLSTFGGGGDDSLRSVVVDDAGTVFATGYTTSFGHGSYDTWLLSLDSSGTRRAERAIGGADSENGNSIVLSGDMLIVAGDERSTLFSGDTGNGWVAKMNKDFDLADGWQVHIGAYGYDSRFNSLLVTQNGIEVLGAVNIDASNQSFWHLRMDANGAYSGTPHAFWSGIYFTGGWALRALPSGGYVLSGSARIPETSVVRDYNWLVAFDGDGVMLWEKGIAVGDDNQGVVPANLAVTNDGIVLAAVAKLGSGNTDAWLVKLGFDGGIVWQKRFGGVGLDSFLDVIATSDGNLLAGGYLTTGNGDQDAWLVKVSPDGVVLAQRRFGGAANEQIRSLAEDTAHGAYVFVGTSGQDGLVGSVPAGDLAGCGAATSVTPVDTAALQAGWTPVASNFNVRSGTTAFLPAAAASTATSTCP